MREEDITTDLICNVVLHTPDLHQFIFVGCCGVVNCESDRVALSFHRGCIVVYFDFHPNTNQHVLMFMVRGHIKAKKKFDMSSERILQEFFKAIKRDKNINYQDCLNAFLRHEHRWGKSNTQKMMEELK